MRPKRKQKSASDGMLTGVEAALRRARQRALEIAARTGTPIIIYRDGKVEKRPVVLGESSRAS